MVNGGHRIVLLGMTPETADSDHGWVLPSDPRPSDPLTRAAAFLDKPGPAVAQSFKLRGGLISSLLRSADWRPEIHGSPS